MKFFTSILETLGYAAKWLGIYLLILALTHQLQNDHYHNSTPHDFIIGVGFCVVIFFVGFGLNRWELHIERKRTGIVKHYDITTLNVAAWLLMILGFFGVVCEAFLINQLNGKNGDGDFFEFLLSSVFSNELMFELLPFVVPSLHLIVSATAREHKRIVEQTKNNEEGKCVEIQETVRSEEKTKTIDVEL